MFMVSVRLCCVFIVRGWHHFVAISYCLTNHLANLFCVYMSVRVCVCLHSYFYFFICVQYFDSVHVYCLCAHAYSTLYLQLCVSMVVYLWLFQCVYHCTHTTYLTTDLCTVVCVYIQYLSAINLYSMCTGLCVCVSVWVGGVFFNVICLCQYADVCVQTVCMYQ